MSRCPSCEAEVAEDAQRCPSCGADQRGTADTEMAQAPSTALSGEASRPATDAEHEYTAGTVIDGRYRIAALLGRGGMGEVYRAADLMLGQDVAIKFLPERWTGNEAYRSRFLSEVRLARQVSHRNVCRVHDIGEARGRMFLSMEYVDGEDLASLLRRIGRLPQEKALEIAHQLCAGMAALHGQGILHRDLKPSNVMLDGRGNVRIADFGLAAIGSDIEGGQARDGTPAYMAPEQLVGSGVSERSDVFALGLVLYELFTGTHAYDSVADRKSQTPADPSSVMRDIDPTVERAIMRCLEAEPGDRPASPLAVAAMLPGGDPLSAALAAGELPSPEMVANAGLEGTLSARWGGSLLVCVIAFAIFAAALMARFSALAQAPPALTPEVLAHQAREVLTHVGISEAPYDWAERLSYDSAYIAFVQGSIREGTGWPGGADQASGALYRYEYRHRDAPLLAWIGPVRENEPPMTRPGEALVVLGSDGQLRRLRVIPPQRRPSTATSAVDWAPVLGAAGFDPGDLEATEPQLTPPQSTDIGAAWIGTGPDGEPARIEAGALGGSVVHFEVVRPWHNRWSEDVHEPEVDEVFELVELGTALIVIIGGALLAIRTSRRREGDLRGAFTIAVVVFGLSLLQAVLTGHHPTPLAAWFAVVVRALPLSLTTGFVAWLAYFVLEPYARRIWPKMLISWVRLIRGRARDPMVGRDILIGCTFGVGMLALGMSNNLVEELIGSRLLYPGGNLRPLLGVSQAAGTLAFTGMVALVGILTVIVLFLVLRLILRSDRAAIIAFILLRFIVVFSIPGDLWVNLVFRLAESIVFVVLVLRFGLLATIAAQLSANLMQGWPIPVGTGHWAFARGMLGPLTLLVVASYGMWVALPRPAVPRGKTAVQ